MDDFDDGHDGHHDGFGALDAGIMYGLYRHGQDRQNQQLIQAMNHLVASREDPEITVEVNLPDDGEDQPGIEPINNVDYSTDPLPNSWADLIGQVALKEELRTHIAAAKNMGEALPHVLLASGYAGVGKTTVARMIAKAMGRKYVELVPPFNIYTLVDAAEELEDHDVLGIDEIHKLADSGKRGAEILLKILEDKVAYLPDGDVVRLNDITIVGATTDRDKLPETVLDRFEIEPFFSPYSDAELVKIVVKFAYRYKAENYVDEDLAITMALASRGTPRVIKKYVLAARAIALGKGHTPTSRELLAFLEVEPDGMTRTHIHYITALRQYFAREKPKGGGFEYVIGAPAIQQILRETPDGLGRIERFLIEQGLLDRTPRGRRLTDRGIARAEQFIREGKGASDVA
jgi:holliday junction DNA helicase RuvB